MRAAFSGALGKEMKEKASGWAHETPNIKKLPDHAGAVKGLKAAAPKSANDHDGDEPTSSFPPGHWMNNFKGRHAAPFKRKG